MSISGTPITLPSIPMHAADPTEPVYTLFAVFRVSSSSPSVFDGHDVEGVVRELEDVIEVIKAENVTLRGYYDLSGLRSDADLMLWLHGPGAEDLQWALRLLRRTSLLRPLIRVQNLAGVQRETKFGADDVPGFVSGVAPKQWISLHPVERSSSWHLLTPADHSRMLSEQDLVREQFTDVTVNIVAGYALGDYDWLVALEDDELTDLVDLTRTLRTVNAKHHVRENNEYYTGRRIELAEMIEVLQ